jgi:hypothetical protein
MPNLPVRRAALAPSVAGLVIPLLASGCAGAPPTVVDAVPTAPAPGPSGPAPAKGNADTHPEEAWYPVRAERLGLPLEAARERDASFSASPPEDGLWWDEHLAKEVWGLWTELCTECHDGGRALDRVMTYPPPPRGWWRNQGRFFSSIREPQQIFRTILHGAKAKEGKDMPGWQGKLANEQVWGLVYFIGAASKKKGNDLR